MPYSAPNFNYLLACRCAVGVTMAPPMQNPLIPDYIKRDSRGKAVALSGIGLVMGEVFSMGVLFNLTKSMNFYDAFKVASSVLLFFIIIFLFIIREPSIVYNSGKKQGEFYKRAMRRH